MSNETDIIPKIVILKPRILYDLNRQPSKIRNLGKKQLILPRWNSSRKFSNGSLWSHSKRLFPEPPQIVLVFVGFDSFVIVLLMSNETGIIPKIVILKTRMLYDPNQQPSKI